MRPMQFGLLLCGFTCASAARADFPPVSPELVVTRAPREPEPSMHPAVVLRDTDGSRVVDSGGLVSYGHTCGACHDTDFITEHGYHFRIGMDEQSPRGAAPSGRSWDFGAGLFGRWDPLAGYDSVFAPSDPQGAAVDRWIAENRPRLLGGGPSALGDQAESFQANCALCHVPGAALSPERELPFEAYQTAALEPLGLVMVRQGADGSLDVDWQEEFFREDGSVEPSFLTPRAATSRSCGACHGLATRQQPQLKDYVALARHTETTGQVYAPTRMSDSALNLASRDTLSRPWDVHAERLLECSDCHFSPNDPSASFRTQGESPAQLTHEVRSGSIDAFLKRPSHEFARGHGSQGPLASAFDGSMRRCEDCHDAPKAHGWLPRAERHLAQVACETCHVNSVAMPARRVTDYSLIDSEGHPRVEHRGIEGSFSDPAATLLGFRPLLLRRTESGTPARVFPYNVITSFFWLVDEPTGARPASIALLRRAFYELDGARAKLMALFDRNRDGKLEDPERIPATPSQLEGLAGLLRAAGAKNPRLIGEIQPYAIHHGVGPARFALRDCSACHGEASRLTEEFSLAERAPFGVAPRLVGDSNVLATFESIRAPDGAWMLRPKPASSGLYVLGATPLAWLDRLGAVLVGLVFCGALGHGAMRLISHHSRKGSSL